MITYKLNRIVEKIICPIVCITDEGNKLEFENGKQAADHEFDKYYLIASMDVKDGKLLICLVENKMVNHPCRIGGEAVSFF